MQALTAIKRVSPVLCAVPVLLVVALAWHRRWIADDAFINFRIVDNVQHGLGPVFNGGERVEAFTSPVWLAILWLSSTVLWFASLEWIAVVLGVLLSALGFAAAARGAWLLWRQLAPVTVTAPLGLLTMVAVPPVWDFATSGLETGLTFAWLGGCLWAVASLLDRGGARVTPVAILAGLGPLVRPDLALFSIGFLVAICVVGHPMKLRAALRLLGVALALPVAYQVFRMGYFAALVPNTALAKEAGVADWSRGWDYLVDFVDPYLLLIPVVCLLVYYTDRIRTVTKNRRALLIAACPAACGLLHTLYIVRLGGDFMHGRMLLPSLFGLLLPVSVVPIQRRLSSAVALAVVPWAVVCAVSLRAPYAGTQAFGPPPARIADERAVYAAIAGDEHPVTVSDHRGNQFARYGTALRRHAEDGRQALILRTPAVDVHGRLRANGIPARSAPARVVATSHPAIGLAGYAAGPDVYVVDQVGLGDPLAARTRLGTIVLPGGVRIPKRYRAGHEKLLPPEWIAARFGPARATFPGIDLPDGGVEAARMALRCRPIERLLTAVTAPMTPRRFASNIGASPSLTRLRFPSDAVEALREECG
jgi:arabinofuranosyltransferase